MAGDDKKLLQALIILVSSVLIISLISAGATFFCDYVKDNAGY
jgi:hypothetical protein